MNVHVHVFHELMPVLVLHYTMCIHYECGGEKKIGEKGKRERERERDVAMCVGICCYRIASIMSRVMLCRHRQTTLTLLPSLVFVTPYSLH